MIITNFQTRYFLVALLILISGFLTACANSDETAESKPSNKQTAAHIVATTTARSQLVQNQLTTSGTIEAGTRVRLYNEVSARIRYLPFHEGDAVATDTVVIGLDDAVIRAELDKAEATREQAKIDYDRLKKLQKKLASDDEIARAATAYDIALADEQLYQTRLRQTSIKAPFEGVITERHFEQGDVVPMHSHIMTLIDPESLQVTIQLAEHWISQIEVGDAASIQIDALANTMHPGSIKRIHPTIDANTRKGTVEIEFQPVPPGARAGQLARVFLKTRPSDRLVVPAHALHHDARGAYLYRVNQDSTTEKVYIDKGEQFGEMIEVTSGINNNDAVVTKGFNGLRHGKKVRVVSQGSNGSVGAS